MVTDLKKGSDAATVMAVDRRQEARRRSFNERAGEYRLARPPYPDEVYDLLATRCGLAPSSRVLEIGAGTGQATRVLLSLGAEVVVVEPGQDLVAHLTTDLAAYLATDSTGQLAAPPSRGRLRVVGSDLETARLPDHAFDMAVSATAFHWVRMDLALPKLARVLRPGGWLAVWWTVFSDPTRPTRFRAAVDEWYARYLPDEPRGPARTPGPLRVASWSAELVRGGWFGPVQVQLVRWEYWLTANRARRLFGSFPNVNELAAQDRTAFLDGIATLIDHRFGGAVGDPYVTAVYLTQRA